MKTINLLPKEEKIRDVKGIIFSTILVLFMVMFAVLIIFSIVLFDTNNNLTPKLDDYKRINMQVHDYVTKLEAYEQFKEKVIAKAELADSLQKEEILWSDFLYDFGKKTPDNTYVNYIEASSGPFYDFISEIKAAKEIPEEIPKILFFKTTGYAVDYTDVTKLIIEIKNMPNIGEVWINNISKNYITESNIEVLFFDISAYMNIGPYLEDLKVEVETQTEETGEEEEVLDTELESLNQ
jgi:uncharacterized protein YxeA